MAAVTVPDVIDVVGMGAEGPSSCSVQGLAALRAAVMILGGRRHLDLVAAESVRLGIGAELIEWPSPLRAGLPDLLACQAGRRVAAIASGDPLVAGVGTTLIDLLGADQVRIHPSVSSVALARARLGWPSDGVEVLRLGAGRSVDELRRLLTPGRRILVLSADESSAGLVAEVCVDAGIPEARLMVLGDLGTSQETRRDTTAADFGGPVPRLNVVGLECPSSRIFAGWLAPGLPDKAYQHDGQLTKRHLRAAALAVLQPTPGELLWDLGAGAGSVGIEWARLHRDNRVIAVERDVDRAERITRNATVLGVPGVEVRIGAAGDLIDELPGPDAVFIGGGARGALIDRCWKRLAVGGRLVVHGVTLETETLLLDRHAALGGELIHLAMSTAQPLGRYRGWSPARPVIQWSIEKENR